jgi:hypothetical protein
MELQSMKKLVDNKKKIKLVHKLVVQNDNDKKKRGIKIPQKMPEP